MPIKDIYVFKLTEGIIAKLMLASLSAGVIPLHSTIVFNKAVRAFLKPIMIYLFDKFDRKENLKIESTHRSVRADACCFILTR